MTTNDETIGAKCKMGIGATSTVDLPLNFDSEDVKVAQEWSADSGCVGTTQEYAEHARIVSKKGGGTINLDATPYNLRYLLPCVLGGVPSGTSYPLAETVPERYLTIDRGFKVFTYFGKFSKMVLKFSPGQKVKMSVDFKAYSVTEDVAGSFPSLSIPTDPPYVCSDAALTLVGSARVMRDGELTIDRAIDEIQANDLGPDALLETALKVMLTCTNPWNEDHSDILESDGAAGSIVMTNDGLSASFSIAKLLCDRADPTASGGKKSPVPMKLNLEGKRTASTAILVVTNDHTP